MTGGGRLALMAFPGTDSLPVSSATGPLFADVPLSQERAGVDMTQPGMHSWCRRPETVGMLTMAFRTHKMLLDLAAHLDRGVTRVCICKCRGVPRVCKCECRDVPRVCRRCRGVPRVCGCGCLIYPRVEGPSGPEGEC